MDHPRNHDSGFVSEYERREQTWASARRDSARAPSYSTTDASKRDVVDEHGTLRSKHDVPFESDTGLAFHDERSELGPSTASTEPPIPSERVPHQIDLKGDIAHSQDHQSTQSSTATRYIPSASGPQAKLTDVPPAGQLRTQPQPPSGLSPASTSASAPAARQYQYDPLSTNAYPGPTTSTIQNFTPSQSRTHNQHPQISHGSSTYNTDNNSTASVHDLLAEILRTGSQQVHEEVYHLLSLLQSKEANHQQARDAFTPAVGDVGGPRTSPVPEVVRIQDQDYPLPTRAPETYQPAAAENQGHHHHSVLSDINTVLRSGYLGVEAEAREKKVTSFANAAAAADERLETAVENTFYDEEGKHSTATQVLKESTGIMRDAFNFHVQPGVGQQGQVSAVGPSSSMQVRSPDLVFPPVKMPQPIYTKNPGTTAAPVNTVDGTAGIAGIGATGKRSLSYPDAPVHNFQFPHRDERYPASFQEYLNQTQIQSASRMGGYAEKGHSLDKSHVAVPVYETVGDDVGGGNDVNDNGPGAFGKERSNGRRRHFVDWIMPVIKFFSWQEPVEEKTQHKNIIPNSVRDRLCYTRECAVEQEKRHRRKAITTGFLLNAAIGSQLLLSAIVTGLSASNTSRHAVSVLGGLGTGVSGFIAHHRGSGEPESTVIVVNDLQKYIRDIDGFINDYGDLDGHTYNDQIMAYRGRLEQLLGNTTDNDDALRAKV